MSFKTNTRPVGHTNQCHGVPHPFATKRGIHSLQRGGVIVSCFIMYKLPVGRGGTIVPVPSAPYRPSAGSRTSLAVPKSFLLCIFSMTYHINMTRDKIKDATHNIGSQIHTLHNLLKKTKKKRLIYRFGECRTKKIMAVLTLRGSTAASRSRFYLKTFFTCVPKK